jgi:ribose transport system permease protein
MTVREQGTVPGRGQSLLGDSPSTKRILRFVERFGLLLLLVGVIVFFSAWSKTGLYFHTRTNFRNIVSNESVIAVVALATIVPLIGGNFDLSVGATAVLADIVAGAAMSHHHASIAFAIVLALAFGATIGLVNGLIVAKAGVNALIATLGSATVIQGLVQWYTNGLPIATGIPSSLTNVVTHRWLGVPRIAVFMIVAAVFTWYVLNQTPYGRYLQSIGSNRVAARLVGIRVDPTIVLSFVLAGILAAVAGVLQLAENGTAVPQNGLAIYLLPALAAAFLGATTIRPGRFNVLGTLVAIFFIACTVQGLNYAGVTSWVQDVFNGTALVLAVALTALLGRRSGRIA